MGTGISTELINSFWQNTLVSLAQEPLEAELEKIDEPLPYQKFSLQLRSLDGVRIRALLSRPYTDKVDKRLPAIVTAPGYGGMEHAINLNECQRGYVVLQIFPRGQGESKDAIDLGGVEKLAWNIEQPLGYYYQGAYADMIRGVDYLAARADVDDAKIAAMGTSQGGGLAVATAALDPRVSSVAAHVPFLCGMSDQSENSGVKSILKNAGVCVEIALQTLAYFDPVNLAPLVNVPVLLSSGGKDLVCPGASIQSVYERLSGIKSLIHYPHLEHTSCSDFYEAGWQWIKRCTG